MLHVVLDWLIDNYFLLDARLLSLTCRALHKNQIIHSKFITALFYQQWPNLAVQLAVRDQIELLRLFDSWKYPLDLRQLLFTMSNSNMLITPDFIDYTIQKTGAPDFTLLTNLLFNGQNYAFNRVVTVFMPKRHWWQRRRPPLKCLPNVLAITAQEHTMRWQSPIVFNMANIFAAYYCTQTGDVSVLDNWPYARYGSLKTILAQKAPREFIQRTIHYIVKRHPELTP